MGSLDRAQAGAVVQRLGGAARDFCREFALGILRDGRQELNPASGTMVQISGLQFLLRGLERRFGEEELDASIQSAVELLTLRRLDNETIDNVLGRYELVRNRADSLAGMQLGEGVLSWLLLTHLGINKRDWPILLAPTRGSLPTTPDEYRALLQQVKRQAHLLERTHSGPRTLEEGWRAPAFAGTGRSTYFGDFGGTEPGADEPYDWSDHTSHSYAGWDQTTDWDAYADWEDDGYGDTDTEPEDGAGMTEEEAFQFVGDMTDTTVE